MANLGYRSIEVMVTNDTRGNLTVQAPTCGSGDGWVQGEAPNQGDSLPQYNAAKWGVYTDDVNGSAMAMVQLTGLGAWPVGITFSNVSSGASSCNVSPNDQVQGLVTQQNTGEINHSLYTVQLIPVS